MFDPVSPWDLGPGTWDPGRPAPLTDIDSLIRRVKRRAFGVSALAVAASFLVSARAGASLTICCAVVLSSFLLLERATEGLVPGRQRARWRTLAPLLLVTFASLALLAVVLLRWKSFEPIAGAVGLSVVVIAIIPEIFRRG